MKSTFDRTDKTGLLRVSQTVCKSRLKLPGIDSSITRLNQRGDEQ